MFSQPLPRADASKPTMNYALIFISVFDYCTPLERDAMEFYSYMAREYLEFQGYEVTDDSKLCMSLAQMDDVKYDKSLINGKKLVIIVSNYFFSYAQVNVYHEDFLGKAYYHPFPGSDRYLVTVKSVNWETGSWVLGHELGHIILYNEGVSQNDDSGVHQNNREYNRCEDKSDCQELWFSVKYPKDGESYHMLRLEPHRTIPSEYDDAESEPWTKYDLLIQDAFYPILYRFDYGFIEQITTDYENFGMTLYVNAHSDGDLIIKLPRQIISTQEFFVVLNNNELAYSQDAPNPDYVTLTIHNVPAGISKILIVGDYILADSQEALLSIGDLYEFPMSSSIPRPVDLDGNAVEVVRNKNMFIQTKVENKSERSQTYDYIIQVENSERETVHLIIGEATLEAQTYTYDWLPWTPEHSGEHTIKVFFWDMLEEENPIALSKPQILGVSVQ